jgi:CRP/FNR family cyclic AMP-dependent transcriptional regulator
MTLLTGTVAKNCQNCEYRTLRLFCSLNDEALRQFDEIGTHLAFPARAIVFEEGQLPSNLFVVCTGQLKLSTTSRDGRTMILRLAHPGDVLGLSAALSGQPYEVTTETLEPSEMKRVPRTEFLHFLESYSEVGRKAAESVSREYREVFLDARRLALSGSAAGRLAQLLLEWAATAACSGGELRFTMALTHEELANMAGSSRETVTRLLNQFERDQLITRRGSSLTILNPSSLGLLSQ